MPALASHISTHWTWIRLTMPVWLSTCLISIPICCASSTQLMKRKERSISTSAACCPSYALVWTTCWSVPWAILSDGRKGLWKTWKKRRKREIPPKNWTAKKAMLTSSVSCKSRMKWRWCIRTATTAGMRMSKTPWRLVRYWRRQWAYGWCRKETLPNLSQSVWCSWSRTVTRWLRLMIPRLS